MNFKKNKPFILCDKEEEQRLNRFHRKLINAMLICAFLLPLIFNGILNYTHLYYVKSNVALVALDVFLDYFIKLGVAVSQYACFALLAVSLYYFGFKGSHTVVALRITSIFVTYIIIGYCVSCLEAGYVLYDFSDVNGAFVFFYALFSALVFALRDLVLIIFCTKAAKKAASAPYSPNKIFDSSSPFRRLCIHFFSMSLALDIVINLIRALGEIVIAGIEEVSSSGTLVDIVVSGMPENLAQYVYLLEPFATVIFENLVGLLIMLFFCGILALYHERLVKKQA